MNLKEIYSQNKQSSDFGGQKTVISFEVFPPKIGEAGEQKLVEELKILQKFNPALISLTYGAGGTNRNSSLNLIKKIQQEIQTPIMPHFTCVCSSKSDIEQYLKEIEQLGLKNILALRGDEPQEIDVCHLDFRYANELVEFIKSKTDLSIGVAGYPECHNDCASLELDIQNLKKKVVCGADVVYSQLFFDNEKFLKFRDLTQEAGIELPLVAGILPVTSYAQLDRMLEMCKVSLPQKFAQNLEKFKNNPNDIKKIGTEFALEQCQDLIKNEVAGLHFYTLNKACATSQILKNL